MSDFVSFEDRLAAKRAEDKARSEQSAKDEELARAKRDSERKFTNPARKEEAVARYKELLSPQQNAPKQKAQVVPKPLEITGANMNISIYTIGENSEGISGPSSLHAIVYVRNGILIGTVDPEDSPTSLIELSISSFTGFIS